MAMLERVRLSLQPRLFMRASTQLLECTSPFQHGRGANSVAGEAWTTRLIWQELKKNTNESKNSIDLILIVLKMFE